MNHPNRSKQQQAKHMPGAFPELTRAGLEELCLLQNQRVAELLTALNGLLNCFNSSGEIEETTQDQLSVALENAEKAQAKAEGR